MVARDVAANMTCQMCLITYVNELDSHHRMIMFTIVAIAQKVFSMQGKYQEAQARRHGIQLPMPAGERSIN